MSDHEWEFEMVDGIPLWSCDGLVVGAYTVTLMLNEYAKFKDDIEKIKLLIVDCPECYRTLLGMTDTLAYMDDQ